MLKLYDREVESRLLLGTSLYPSPQVMLDAIGASGSQILTLSLRREMGTSEEGGQDFWELIRKTGLALLPNTAGCTSAREAITTARMARELFDTSWIKLEVIGENDTLQPNLFATVEAAQTLCADGFQVFPYTTEDLVAADELVSIGCKVLMPWGAPIGSGQGLNNPRGLARMRGHFPDTKIIVDAGIGLPSHAARAMELGADAVLLNTAVARAHNPVTMACAMRLAVEAGFLGRDAGPMPERNMASPSTPVFGKASFGAEPKKDVL